MNQNYFKDNIKNSNKLSRYSNLNNSHLQSRLSINQKLTQKNRINKTNIIFQSSEITQQVQKEIQQIQQLFERSKNQINLIKQKNKLKQRTIKYEIFHIQQYIQHKDKQIKLINQQIKFLKVQNNNDVSYNRITSNEDLNSLNNSINIYPNINNNNNNSYIKKSLNVNNNNSIGLSYQKQNNAINFVFKLAQQLKDQKQLMIKLLKTHEIKSQSFNEMKEKISKLQQKYIQKCRQTKQRPLRYEDFKQLNQQKKKEIYNIETNTIYNHYSHHVHSNANLIASNHQTNFNQKINQKKQVNNSISPNKKNSIISPPRDFIFNNYQQSNIYQNKQTKKQQSNKKTLKQLQNKKNIAEQALKNSKKKHNHQLNQLMAKIQFLRDQEEVLYEKIKQKQQQKSYLQLKFNETTKVFYNLNQNKFKNIDKGQININSNRKLGLSISRKQLLSNRHYLQKDQSSLSKQKDLYSMDRKNSYYRKLMPAKQRYQSNNQGYQYYYIDKNQI